MNTKSSNITINPEYADLFVFANDKEKYEHNAQMISYKILSEVERVCEIRKLKKKDLAQKIGTSKSYITQLFRGNKSINTQIMAKFEDILNITFEIEASFNEIKSEFVGEKLNFSNFQNPRINCSTGTWYFCYNKDKKAESKNENKIVENLKTESKTKQAA